MIMKLLKIQISSDILSKRGHPLIFEYISFIEIQNILQYDPNNLFLLAKIIIDKELEESNDFRLIEAYDTVQFFHVLKRRANELLCLLRLNTSIPLWPELEAKIWAVIPPIIMDPTSLHFNLIVSEKALKILHQFLSEQANSYRILAIEDVKRNFQADPLISPNFTNRQRKISQYAYRNGYFESPKKISAREIAEKFEISSSAITKHLRKTTKKAMKFFFS